MVFARRSFIQNSKNYTETSMQNVNPTTPNSHINLTPEFSFADDNIIKGINYILLFLQTT